MWCLSALTGMFRPYALSEHLSYRADRPGMFRRNVKAGKNAVKRSHIRSTAFQLFVVDDLSEVFLQGSAADEAAVDIGLCEQLGSGLAIDRAAVLNADLLCSVSVIDLSNELTDRMVDFTS